MVLDLGHWRCLQGILPMNTLSIKEMILNIEPNLTVLKDAPYSDHLWTQLLTMWKLQIQEHQEQSLMFTMPCYTPCTMLRPLCASTHLTFMIILNSRFKFCTNLHTGKYRYRQMIKELPKGTKLVHTKGIQTQIYLILDSSS